MFERSLLVALTAESVRRPRAPVKGVTAENVVRLSRAERFEMIFAAASMGVGECPARIVLAIERCDIMELDSEERRPSC